MTLWEQKWLRGTVWVAGAVLFCGSGFGQSNTAPRRVSSTAGQFTAHSPDAVSSSVLCVLATQIKREWLRRLDLPDKWRDPIVLLLAERDASLAAAPNVWQEVARTDLHLKFEIHLRIPPPLDETDVAETIVQALCREFANRSREFPRHPPFAITEPPLWLTAGLTQSIVGEPNRLLPLLRRYVQSGHPMSAQELIGLTQCPAEPAERLRFRAHAWAWVEGLLSLPKGREKLSQLLCEPLAFAEIYRWQFPDETAREKWWSLLLAERAAAMIDEDRSATTTSQRLAAILPGKVQMRLPDAVAEAPVAFEELGRYTEKDWLAPMVRDKLARLVSLRGIAHPSYLKAIDHYIAALEQLQAGRVSRFQYETRQAQRAYAAADQQSRQIAEYVRRVERVYSPPDPEELRRPMRLLETIQEMNVLRRDPIRDYLDQFDK